MSLAGKEREGGGHVGVKMKDGEETLVGGSTIDLGNYGSFLALLLTVSLTTLSRESLRSIASLMFPICLELLLVLDSRFRVV